MIPASSTDRPVASAVRTLRATRDYAPGDIDDERIADWIEAARWCGSSKNTQPWHLVVVKDRRTLQALSQLGDHTSHLARCTVGIAFVMSRTNTPFSVGIDLGRLVQALMLVAQEDGIGSCIGAVEGEENRTAAREVLAVPGHLDLDLVVGFGVPGPWTPLPPGVPRPSPRGRRSTAEITSWERYGRPGLPT